MKSQTGYLDVVGNYTTKKSRNSINVDFVCENDVFFLETPIPDTYFKIDFFYVI